MEDEEQRTTALGLFNYAQAYWQAGRALKRSKFKAIHRDAPTTYVFCHAIELFLKAYLRANDVSAADLAKTYGHRIAKIAAATKSKGLPLDEEEDVVIDLIEFMNVLTLRYIRSGAVRRPTIEALDRTCKSFNRSVGLDLRRRGLRPRGVPRR